VATITSKVTEKESNRKSKAVGPRAFPTGEKTAPRDVTWTFTSLDGGVGESFGYVSQAVIHQLEIRA